MLPTPSKTPKKRSHAAAITSTARILSFQPNHPNDAMPSPRRINKSQHRSLTSRAGFELFEDDVHGSMDGANDGDIEIYTDANARVPVLDESEDNPFVGPKRATAVRPQRRRQRMRDLELDAKAGRGEGVVYVFRGKKIFRPFANSHAEAEAGDHDAEEAASTADQRRLRHQAGSAAQRPLTRSAIKPRLLFPSSSQHKRDSGNAANDDVDEEAVTDIEMDNASANAAATPPDPVSPPPTHQKKKSRPTAADSSTPAPMEEESEPMSLGTDESFASSSASGARKQGTGKNLFDAWPRTKSSRKRAGGAVEYAGVGVSGAKRARGQVVTP